MAAAVNNFAHGHSGIRLEVVEQLVALLNADCLPEVPAFGSVGYLSHMAHIALVCIGGHYTMDRHDAVDACDFVGAKTIIPCHYNTFPAIETDAGAFQTDIEKTLDAVAVVLEPGAVHEA